MKTLKTIQNVLSSVLLGIVVAVLVVLVAIRIFGIKTYVVLSGSMEDVYPTGSMIYVSEVDYKTLAVGDTITYRLNETTVATHRIFEIVPSADDPDNFRFRTKGDENEEPDGGFLSPSDVIGKPFLAIPYLGYIVNYIQHPPGVYIMVTVCAVALIFAFLPTGKNDSDGSDKEESES